LVQPLTADLLLHHTHGPYLPCAAALPPLHRGNPWLLLYSTARDGISLSTLMRKAEKVGGVDEGGACCCAHAVVCA
jgi:hypothetical protein